jgi:hypothetical protein
MQTGDRISYHPAIAFAEVSGLSAKLSSLTKIIDAMHATETSPAFSMMSQDRKYQSQKLEEYNGLINTALAHIADINPSPSVSSNGTTRTGLSRKITGESQSGGLEIRNLK